MDDKWIHWIKTAALKDNYLYCVYGRYNILFRIDITSWKYEKIAILEWSYQGKMATDVYTIGGKIICVSMSGVKIAVYDPKTEKIEYDSIETESIELVESMVCNDKIWFFPRNLSERLYYYSLEQKRFFEDDIWKKAIDRIGLWGRINRKCFVENGEIYIVHMGRVVNYNSSTCYMKEIVLPIKGNCVDIVKMDETYYFLTEESKREVFCWNTENGQISGYEGVGKGAYIKLTKVGEAIFLDTGKEIDILINGDIRRWEFSGDVEIKGSSFINAVKYVDKWLLLPWGNTFFVECLPNGTIEGQHKIEVSPKDIWRNKTFLLEPELSLDDFIAAVQCENKNIINDWNSAGQKIYGLFR